MADDVEVWHAAPFHKVVAVAAVFCRGDAVQGQHAVFKVGGEAEAVVGEAVQDADKLVEHDVAAAGAGQVGHRFVADAAAPRVVGCGVELGAEVLRFPVGEDDVRCLAFDASFDFADTESLGQRLQVKVAQAQGKAGIGGVTEEAADVQVVDMDGAAEGMEVDRLLQLQAVAVEADVRQGTAEGAGEADGVKRCAELAEADGLDAGADFVGFPLWFEAVHGDAAIEDGDVQGFCEGDAACVPAVVGTDGANRQFAPAAASKGEARGRAVVAGLAVEVAQLVAVLLVFDMDVMEDGGEVGQAAVAVSPAQV